MALEFLMRIGLEKGKPFIASSISRRKSFVGRRTGKRRPTRILEWRRWGKWVARQAQPDIRLQPVSDAFVMRAAQFPFFADLAILSSLSGRLQRVRSPESNQLIPAGVLSMLSLRLVSQG
jgi:hypothetical protein